MQRSRRIYRGYGSETRTLTVTLVGGAIAKFDVLQVKTHLGEYDVLAGKQPVSKSGQLVYIFASIINNGDLAEVCTIVCEYPVGKELWRWSGSLSPGENSSLWSWVIGSYYPFNMPTTNAIVKISCTP